MDDLPRIEIVWPSGKAEAVPAEQAYWNHLVDIIYETPQGLEGLSPEDRVLWFTGCFNGEVLNGGFHQFFSNSAGEHYKETLDALGTLGLERPRALLIKAKEIIFGSKDVPVDRMQRYEMMGHPDDTPEIMKQLEILDREYYNGLNDVVDKAYADYQKEHDLIGKYVRRYNPKIVE